MKQAILVTSFGTTHSDTLEKTIVPTETALADLPAMIDLLTKAYPLKDGQLALFMGHGTYQPTRALYEELARLLPQRTGGRYHLCTVEGVPAFADGIREVCSLPQREILLAPMLLVAGDHAKNDMAGPQPESLRSLLEAQGFSVECSLRGLGELEDIRQWYIRRAKAAADTLPQSLR